MNIDGEKMAWSQFKRKFAKELSSRTDQGELVKNAQFILNKDKGNEKLMEWHYKNGYRSEDSEDEMTIYGRSERQYYRQLRQKYGEDAILLKKRAVMPFERLIIDQLGGK